MGFVMAILIIPVAFLMLMHNERENKSKMEIARLTNENKSLRKQLTEAPFRRDHRNG